MGCCCFGAWDTGDLLGLVFVLRFVVGLFTYWLLVLLLCLVDLRFLSCVLQVVFVR